MKLITADAEASFEAAELKLGFGEGLVECRVSESDDGAAWTDGDLAKLPLEGAEASCVILLHPVIGEVKSGPAPRDGSGELGTSSLRAERAAQQDSTDRVLFAMVAVCLIMLVWVLCTWCLVPA